jgi:protein tyrosine/serine phosphatase
LLKSGNLNEATVDECYLQLYRELPFDPVYRAIFAESIRRIAASSGRVLVHCTGGKDRTGILVALILHSLGASDDDILADYMRSSRALGLLAMKQEIMTEAKKRYGHELSPEGVDMLLDVKPAYLATALAAIEGECGSVGSYLAAAGVSDNTLVELRGQLIAH